MELLNRYYVPVYTANEDYRDGGAAPADERAQLDRIRKEGHAAGLSVGTVHVFVLAPDGRLLDTMHVALARPDTLAQFLEKHARALNTAAGSAVVKPAPPAPPSCPPGALQVHVVARYLERQPDGGYALVTNAGGNWSALPGEDWVALDRDALNDLLPPKSAPGAPLAAGRTWNVGPAVAAPLLNRFYPPTENNDLAKNRIERQTLRATVVSVTGKTALARLDGELVMKHPFYHKDDNKVVRATIVGYVEFEPASRRVRSLRLVTDRATYGEGEGGSPFGVVVRSVPEAGGAPKGQNARR